MKRLSLSVLIAALGIAVAPAHAGIYADDLTRCVVAKTSSADQTAFVQWLFSAMTASPAVQSMSTLKPAERVAYSKSAANLFQRLILSDCRPQTVAAIKYEGAAAMQQSFEMLGRVAMQNLMSDPAVTKELQSLDSMSDHAAFAALAKEAGVPDPYRSAAPLAK